MNTQVATSQIYRNDYNESTGFQEYLYPKLNPLRIRDIRDIFAIRTKTYNFKQDLFDRHILTNLELCACQNGPDNLDHICECFIYQPIF